MTKGEPENDVWDLTFTHGRLIREFQVKISSNAQGKKADATSFRDGAGICRGDMVKLRLRKEVTNGGKLSLIKKEEGTDLKSTKTGSHRIESEWKHREVLYLKEQRRREGGGKD